MSGHQTWTDPSYPFCDICEQESDDDRGWCHRCQSFVSDHPPQQTLDQLLEKYPEMMRGFEPLSELRRENRDKWAA